MHSTARHLCQLSSCDLSMLQRSVIFQNGWQVHQSGSISHKKTPLPDGPSRGFQRGEGAIFPGHAFAWGQASTGPCGTGTEPCWKRAVPLEPGRSPAPQRGACWEGDVGHRPQLGVCCAAQHYRSPLPRRRDVPLTLMVKTGGMCVSLPAGAAVNTCRLAATKTQQPDEVSTALGEKIRSMLSFTLEYFKSAIRILTRFFLPWVSLSMPLPMKSRSHSI